MSESDKLFLLIFVVALFVLGLHVAAWVFIIWLAALLLNQVK